MKVFVYGTLQRNRGNHHYLANATYLGEAVTDNTFEMVDVGFPIMRPSADRKARRVKGQLFDIGNDTAAGRQQNRRVEVVFSNPEGSFASS